MLTIGPRFSPYNGSSVVVHTSAIFCDVLSIWLHVTLWKAVIVFRATNFKSDHMFTNTIDYIYAFVLYRHSYTLCVLCFEDHRPAGSKLQSDAYTGHRAAWHESRPGRSWCTRCPAVPTVQVHSVPVELSRSDYPTWYIIKQ